MEILLLQRLPDGNLKRLTRNSQSKLMAQNIIESKSHSSQKKTGREGPCHAHVLFVY
jgi:hypothetical protein